MKRVNTNFRQEKLTVGDRDAGTVVMATKTGKAAAAALHITAIPLYPSPLPPLLEAPERPPTAPVIGIRGMIPDLDLDLDLDLVRDRGRGHIQETNRARARSVPLDRRVYSSGLNQTGGGSIGRTLSCLRQTYLARGPKALEVVRIKLCLQQRCQRWMVRIGRVWYFDGMIVHQVGGVPRLTSCMQEAGICACGPTVSSVGTTVPND